MKQTWKIIVISILLIIFSTQCTKMDEPEAAARNSFSEWAVNIRVPYKHETFQTLTNDGKAATVRITVDLKLNGEWKEKQIEVNCEKMEEEWQCERSIKFE